jgi:hypothetical protein
MSHAPNVGSATIVEETHQAPGPVAHGIAAASHDVDRQGFGNVRLPFRARNVQQRLEHIDRQLHRKWKGAQAVGDVFVDLNRIARKPVKWRARRAKRLLKAPKVRDWRKLFCRARPIAIARFPQPSVRSRPALAVFPPSPTAQRRLMHHHVRSRIAALKRIGNIFRSHLT